MSWDDLNAPAERPATDDLAQAVAAMFATPAGKVVMEHLVRQFLTTFPPVGGGVELLSRFEGRRDVVRWLLAAQRRGAAGDTDITETLLKTENDHE